jgi:hypothetical protein
MLVSKFTLLVASDATDPKDLSTPRDSLALSIILANLTSGTGLNQANYQWHDTRTLTGGASETVTVTAPIAIDYIGRTLALTKIKALYIQNKSTTAGNILKIGGDGSTAAWNSFFDGSDTAKCIIQPGGCLLVCAPDLDGLACAAGTNAALKINNVGGSSLDYDIILIGS